MKHNYLLKLQQSYINLCFGYLCYLLCIYVFFIKFNMFCFQHDSTESKGNENNELYFWCRQFTVTFNVILFKEPLKDILGYNIDMSI